MPRLNNSDFLTSVSELLTKNQGKSSVYLTQKRLKPSLDVEESSEINDLSLNVLPTTEFGTQQHFPVLIRVSMNGKNSKKTKLSTVIEVDRLDEFWSEYSQIIKSGFVGLKKKDKKKSKKNKVKK